MYSPLLVRMAVESGVSTLILVHTTGIYSKYKAAGEEYRRIEKDIDEYIRGKNIALTILRPTMIYGTLADRNVTTFIKMVEKLRIFPTVKGAKYELQPVFCGDLGKAYYLVLKNLEQVKRHNYDLSGGRAILLIDMFKVIQKQLGVKNVFISAPYSLSYAGAWLLYLLTFKKKDYREKVQRLVEPRAYSHDDATKDFGYAPVDFETGVAAQIEEYLRRKNSEK